MKLSTSTPSRLKDKTSFSYSYSMHKDMGKFNMAMDGFDAKRVKNVNNLDRYIIHGLSLSMSFEHLSVWLFIVHILLYSWNSFVQICDKIENLGLNRTFSFSLFGRSPLSLYHFDFWFNSLDDFAMIPINVMKGKWKRQFIGICYVFGKERQKGFSKNYFNTFLRIVSLRWTMVL